MPPELVKRFLDGDPKAEAEIDHLQREQVAAKFAGTGPTTGISIAQMTPAEQAAHVAAFEPPASPDDYKIHIGHPLDEAGQQKLASARA